MGGPAPEELGWWRAVLIEFEVLDIAPTCSVDAIAINGFVGNGFH
jgi:hypothetical protein